MKSGLTSFDIRALVGELDAALRGAYLDKVYQENSSFILRFNARGGGKPELFVEPGRWLFLGEKLEKPPRPPAFAQGLRRDLLNAVLRGVFQRGFDRIVLLELEKKSPYTLVLEMFGKGNVVLLKDGTIERALRRGRWRDREVRTGLPYRFPPEGINPTALGREDFVTTLGRHEGTLVKVLAASFGLGRLYAEELLLRAGLPKSRPVDALDGPEIEALYVELQSLLGQLESPAPALIAKDGAMDAVPFALRVYEGYEVRPFRTMSEALQAFLRAQAETQEEDREDPATARLERRIRRQERMMTETLENAEMARGAAEYLYEHYQEVERAIKLAKEGRTRDGVDPARKTLRLPVGQASVELHYDESVDANARRLYDERKALAAKAIRIEEALAESRREAERVRKTAARRERRPSYAPSKRLWFDAYRWTLSSEGVLILGGRNARSNEKLVRKHLGPGDRYVHADLTGAPSVVVKEGAEAAEQTLREACRFALVYSKAWRLGVGSGSAFWVTPDQVSKTAQSGEYLKTGSFVVRGKRNYFHNLALTLGVGEVEVEGSRRVIAGDPDALRTLSPRYLLAKPAGPWDRKSLVRALSASFEVPPVEVERILPTGSFDITEAHGLRWEEPRTS